MPNILHKLFIGASDEKVYNAITSQEGLSEWWTPHTNTRAELDIIARFNFGSGYFKEMKITELSPFRFVKWICITGDDEWIGTTISFQLYTGDKGIAFGF